MDLTHPISTAIPSLDGVVLRALASTTSPLSLTEVADLAGRGSLSGIRKVLQRLVEHGLVHHGRAGYALNREHIAAGPIEQLAALHGELVARLRRWLEARHETVVAAGMFGSAARRDGGTASDVDVVVITDEEVGTHLADDLADQLELWTGNRGHVVVLTSIQADDLRQQRPPIAASWAQDLQMVLGDRAAVVG